MGHLMVMGMARVAAGRGRISERLPNCPFAQPFPEGGVAEQDVLDAVLHGLGVQRLGAHGVVGVESFDDGVGQLAVDVR
jgi:hypothetical protein